jgi:hypothetical protein
MSEIMEVPFPLAASKRLINFFTVQISMFFSASFAWASDILTGLDASRVGVLEVVLSLFLDSVVHRVKNNLRILCW